jgi:ribosomal protein S18 acetylase RimI-like enzyme
MRIRTFRPSDLEALTALTIGTFRPFYEQSFPAMVDHDADLITHQHGQWEQDYRVEVPRLHDPATGRHVLVGETDDGVIAGYVAWRPDSRPEHVEITLLAVDAHHRQAGLATALMNDAMIQMRRDGNRFVGLGTGGDQFHAPARHLYESLGFHPIPIVGYLRSL